VGWATKYPIISPLDPQNFGPRDDPNRQTLTDAKKRQDYDMGGAEFSRREAWDISALQRNGCWYIMIRYDT